MFILYHKDLIKYILVKYKVPVKSTADTGDLFGNSGKTGPN